MLKILVLGCATAIALTSMQIAVFAQVQRAPTDDKSPPKKMTTSMKHKSMRHGSMHRGMKKPMSTGSM